jgi:hypothetical protein
MKAFEEREEAAVAERERVELFAKRHGVTIGRARM